MFKFVPVFVALVCLSAPSIGRSWGGGIDPTKDNYKQKSWASGPNGPDRANHGWGPDSSSSEGESWESYENYNQGVGYVKDKFPPFGYHYNHEGHNYDHHNHGDYGYHHQWPNHQEHEHHNFDSKYDYHGHHSRPEYPVPPSFGLPQNNKGNAHNNVIPNKTQNPGSKPSTKPQNSLNKDQPSWNNADQFVFPDDSPIPNLSTTRRPPVTSSSTRSPAPAVTQPPATSTTISSLLLQDIVRCIRDCPSTPQFNPVCGTNNVTYNNIGLLECNRNCGVNVELKRRSMCPQAPPPSFFFSIPNISTEQPIVNAPAGNGKNNSPIGRSASEQAAAPAMPLTSEKPTRFTNIQVDQEFEIDRRVNPTK